MGVEDLASVTLISDGASVYEMTSPDELVDLLAGGQGVFAIAVGKVASETRGQLATLPSERVVHENDELAQRRRKKAAATSAARPRGLPGGWGQAAVTPLRARCSGMHVEFGEPGVQPSLAR